MKKTTAKTTSPKKAETAADLSARTLHSTEYDHKELQQDIKGWQDKVRIMKESLQKIEQGIQSETPIDKQELNKLYLTTEALSAKVDKEIEKVQTQLHKAQLQFEKTLCLPQANGDFNHLGSEQREEIKRNINTITELMVQNKNLLEEILESTIDCAKRLKALESPVSRICLTEYLDETIDVNEKLNKRLQAIQEAASILFQPIPATSLPANSKQFSFGDTSVKLMQLYDNHQKGAKLLADSKKQFDDTPAERLRELSLTS